MGVDAGVVTGQRAAGLGEMLFVVGVAIAGVLIAALFALGPWSAGAGHIPVVRFQPPVVTAPSG